MFYLQFTDLYTHSALYEALKDLELPSDTENILDKDIKRTYYNVSDWKTQTEKEQKNNQLRIVIK